MNCKEPAMKMVMLVLVVLTMATICAGQTYWQKAYGGNKNDWANAITATPDGNFIIAGTTESFGAGGEDVYLLKIKPNGDTIWTRTYGGGDNDVAYAITPTLDGNFIVAGQTTLFGTYGGYGNVYILKINPDGDTLWTKTYGVSYNAMVCAIVQTPDGNFTIAGSTDSIVNGSSGVYLMKIRPDGDTIWTNAYGGCSGNAIALTQDGNFIVAGVNCASHVSGTGFGPGSMIQIWESGNPYFLKVNSNGDKIWARTYGNDSLAIDEARAVTPTSGGNFIAAGNKSSTASGVSLLKIKPNGDTLLTRNYSTCGSGAYAIAPTSDGNSIVVAFGCTFLPGGLSVGSDNYFLKINPDGGIIWTKNNGSGANYANAITRTPDGNFIATGTATSFGSGGWDVYILSMIDDQYAYNNIPFSFKIPGSDDSLLYTYTPVHVPPGMTVSKGGTISWTPQTESVYTEYINYAVSKGTTINDTLTFNIFVNSQYHPTKTVNPVSRSSASSPNAFTIHPFSSKEVRFSLPSGTSSLRVYDVRGQLLENLSVRNNQAIWSPKHKSGRYFAKAIYEKSEMIKGFTIVK